jgi:hypothetical protein
VVVCVLVNESGSGLRTSTLAPPRLSINQSINILISQVSFDSKTFGNKRNTEFLISVYFKQTKILFNQLIIWIDKSIKTCVKLLKKTLLSVCINFLSSLVLARIYYITATTMQLLYLKTKQHVYLYKLINRLVNYIILN